MFFFLTVHWFPYHFCYCTLGWCLWQALLQKCFNLSRQIFHFAVRGFFCKFQQAVAFLSIHTHWNYVRTVLSSWFLFPRTSVSCWCNSWMLSCSFFLKYYSSDNFLLFANSSNLYFKFQLKFHLLYTLCELSTKSESFHHTCILCNLWMYCVFSCKTFIKFF